VNRPGYRLRRTGFLVFLIVLVVGQRLALHQGQQRNQVAVHAAGLAAHQLRHIRVFLLRHDAGAGAEAVGQIDEAEARRHPDHQLLGHARQVGHDQRAGGQEFDGEIAIRHGIQRVFADAVETQFPRHHFPIDGKAGAGQRRCAQRQAIDARGNRPDVHASRVSISCQASMWWPKVTGWAAWRWVKPGMTVAA
jgi:hypothetical protein